MPERDPEAGDFLVLYPAQVVPGSRIQLLRLQANGRWYLVRATFADSSDAAPRFDKLAVELAGAVRARAFRRTEGGPLTVIAGKPPSREE